MYNFNKETKENKRKIKLWLMGFDEDITKEKLAIESINQNWVKYTKLSTEILKKIDFTSWESINGIFNIPEECENISLENTQITGINGSAKIINLGECENISGTFDIPEGCEVINLSGTNITGIKGAVKKIKLNGCNNINGIFTIPEECEDISLSWTNITEIKGSAKKIDLYGCSKISGTFTIPYGCNEINLDDTNISKKIKGRRKMKKCIECGKLIKYNHHLTIMK